METLMRPTWTDERLDEFAKRMDERFDRVDERFDRTDQRFDESGRRGDERFDEFGRRVDERFEEVGRRFDETDRRIDGVSAQLVQQGERLDLVVGALSSVQNSFVLGIVTLVGGLMAGFGAILVLIATKL